MSAIPDVALRDADRWADDEGRRVALDEQAEHLTDDLLEDPDEVEDLIRFGDSSVLARALAELVVRLGHATRGQLPADVSAAWTVTESYLHLLAREEAERRLRDGDVP